MAGGYVLPPGIVTNFQEIGTPIYARKFRVRLLQPRPLLAAHMTTKYFC
jgi:hypothetical protein